MHTTTSSTRPQAVSALREMARTLSAAWDLDTTLDLIARKTTEVMHVDSCTIYLLDPGSDTLRLRASTGLSRRALGRATLKVGEGMTGYAVQENQPVYAAAAQEDPRFKRIIEAEEASYHSLLAVPMVIEAQPIGALNVQTLTTHEFTADEIEVLSLVGDLAAGALAKAQLYDKQRRQIEELRALAQISEVVTSPQYLDDILDVVTEMAAQAMGAAVCSIFLVDETGETLTLRSAKRADSPYQYRPPLRLGEGVIGQVVLTGKPAYIPDVRADERYLGGELAREEGLVSLLAMPLSVRERNIGVLNCYTNEVVQFSEEQLALFATLANQTALAIENARLVTNAAVVREMHHRIKNNLQTVAMLMQLQIPDADRLDTRQVLETNIHRIRSIAAVHESLSEQGFRLVDVKDVLERITRTTAESMLRPDQDVQIAVFGEPLPLPSRAATALTLVVNELVQNALEHAFVDCAVGRVEISLGRSPDELIILVRDNGRGLPPNLEYGLGLELTTMLITDDLHGGLKFNALPEGGTEVSIRLPREIERDQV
ncbi:MAG: GAF domain-containing protein [Chloroflexi bacterium]|nr:GAF domain-containing protein [Chloroflexota bacterium]MBP6803007.1 GAF domain-containing protein [Chloroflexota bacterium]MBP7590722.1 GAF domain-containing protein [Chloroflexota bacterium]